VPRVATVCRLDLAHPGAGGLRAVDARWSSRPGWSAVVHLSPRSNRDATQSGLCDRPRRGVIRRAQPGQTALEGATWMPGPGARVVFDRRPSIHRRTRVRRAGRGDRFVAGVDSALQQPRSASANVKMTWSRRCIVWYQRLVEGRPSPCRFTPSCSAYALEALELHGRGRGAWLTLRRLVRCRPFGPSGWDPVPEPHCSSRLSSGSLSSGKRASA
jgi:putative membrane protein insertion efficiency factor